MNNDETFIAHHSHRLLSRFAVIFTVIFVCDNRSLENQGGIKNIDFSGFYYFFPFFFIPLKFQLLFSKKCASILSKTF